MLGVVIRTLLGTLIGASINMFFLWLFGFNVMIAPLALCIAFPAALFVNYKNYKKDKEHESL